MLFTWKSWMRDCASLSKVGRNTSHLFPIPPHLPGIVLGLSFLSHCCCKPVLLWQRRSGRRQEILVTLTAAAPFLLSSSDDVGWLWWQELRNWAIAKVGKRGHCLCRTWPGDPCGAVCFLPFYTVSLSVPLFFFFSGRAQASCFQNSRLFFWQMNSRSNAYFAEGEDNSSRWGELTILETTINVQI